MSNRYTNDSIHFYKVDVENLYKIAKKYQVDTDPSGKQIPTLLMLENGKEVGRFPPIPKNGEKIEGKYKYNEQNIARYLELDSKFYMTSSK